MFKTPKFAPQPHEQKRELKARLTLAYLAAFRELGYQYILTSKLVPVRQDFLVPLSSPANTGLYFISIGFNRDDPHAYFDGWCDTFDEKGDQTNSVFTCYSDPTSETIQIRIRHITVMLPRSDRGIVLARKPGTPPNTSVNLR